MLELVVNLGERSYPIKIASGLITQAPEINSLVGKKRVVIITNKTIAPLYLEQFRAQFKHQQVLTLSIDDGEQFKSLDTFAAINGFLLEHNCGRDTILIALGGGVIGDLVGFVAACYQRGVPFIQVPTTLLSQVDSSVGGKTAVNHPLGKNMIGAFYQPQAVYIDIATLKTLPPREFSAGIAEVIKYGLICDTEFFDFIEANQSELLSLQERELAYVIEKCCSIKADIVAQDEKESGLRALLNLGHTFGHAIEAQMGYGNWLHGEAVATGMVLACQLAELRGWLTSNDVMRVISLLKAFNLPVTAPKEMTFDNFILHMLKDKKNQNGKIRFIVPTSFGECAMVDDVTEQELATLFKVHAG
jgi:3-dehydroquinate synthase